MSDDEKNTLDELVTITLTGRQLLMARWCVRYVNDKVSLEETFTDENYAAPYGDDEADEAELPTETLARKLALYEAGGDEAVLVAIRKEQESA